MKGNRITGQSPNKLRFGIASNHVKQLLTTEDNSEDLETETAPWVDTENINITEDKVNEHDGIVHALRKSSFQKSSHESSKMANWRLVKFPGSLYHNGDEKVQVGKDQEKAQSEKRFPLQKPRWEKNKLTIRYLYHENIS